MQLTAAIVIAAVYYTWSGYVADGVLKVISDHHSSDQSGGHNGQ